MIKTIHKWFWIWDFDKEERWLNKMAQQGLSLHSVGFCRYDFEETAPNAYRICLDMPEKGNETQYVTFLEETGAEHLGRVARWHYFRKKGDEDFSLYSDNASRIALLTRIIRFIALVGGLNLYLGCYNLFLHAQWQLSMNLIGLVSIAISLLAVYGVIRLRAKRERLKNEQQIFE